MLYDINNDIQVDGEDYVIALNNIEKKYGYMVGFRDGEIVPVPLEEVAGKLKMVDPESTIIKEAKGLGICFGD